VNRLALGWVDTALALEEELERERADNRLLRAAVIDLALALDRERELFGFARSEIDARWPDRGQAAA
jgi:hypothetical protein